MTTPYAQRLVDIVITAGAQSATYTPPKFGPSGGNTLTLSGYRLTTTITNAGGYSIPMAEVTIFGLSLSLMNELSSLAQPQYFYNNVGLTILAGSQQDGMAIAFDGFISSALPDFSSAPETSFTFLATSQLNAAMDTPSPLSFSGAVSIGTICQKIATNLGLVFENNGCTAVLTNQYLPGSSLDQLQRATQAANVIYTVENGILAIWPNNSYRTSQSDVPLISPETGLVGYPAYGPYGINFRTLYNPTLKFGGQIQMQSSLTPACGKWAIYNLTHLLDSKMPRGNWFTDVQTITGSLWPQVTSGEYG